jgi:hypothetical protein
MQVFKSVRELVINEGGMYVAIHIKHKALTFHVHDCDVRIHVNNK